LGTRCRGGLFVASSRRAWRVRCRTFARPRGARRGHHVAPAVTGGVHRARLSRAPSPGRPQARGERGGESARVLEDIRRRRIQCTRRERDAGRPGPDADGTPLDACMHIWRVAAAFGSQSCVVRGCSCGGREREREEAGTRRRARTRTRTARAERGGGARGRGRTWWPGGGGGWYRRVSFDRPVVCVRFVVRFTSQDGHGRGVRTCVRARYVLW
jgi:hypothetical protein